MLLEVPCRSTNDCLKKACCEVSRFEEIKGCMVFALNEKYTTESSIVKDTNELAIIPPIRGG